jgi:large subunit ribosomal protein L18
MAKGPTYKVKYRRHREGKTDYHKRKTLLLSEKKRLVVRRGANNIVAQIVEYTPKGDKILFSFTSKNLKKIGWDGHGGNLSSAYLVGYALGLKAKGVKEAILDTGLHKITRGSAIFSCLKGVIDAGLKVPYDEKILPKESRIKGEHINKEYPIKFESMKKKIGDEFGI